MKEAIYYKKFHQLTYFVSRNTSTTINCVSVKAARFTLLVTKKLYKVEQTLIIR